MERTQSADARERAASSEFLAVYYEQRPPLRGEFLATLGSVLIDVRDGHVLPSAAAPLLTCVARAIEVGFDGKAFEFRQLITTAALPLANSRFLPAFVSELCAVFTQFMARCPLFGVDILFAVQRNWPLSTRAAATARLVIAVFCVLDAQYADPLVPSFFAFLADCLLSSESMLVTAALEIFDRPDGIELIALYAGDAIAKLYRPLLEVQRQAWQYKSSEKVRLCLEALERVSPELFLEISKQRLDTLSGRAFPQEQWNSVVAMVAGDERPAEMALSARGTRGVAQIARVVTMEDRSQAVLGRGKQRMGTSRSLNARVRGGVRQLIMPYSKSASRMRGGRWPHSVHAIGGRQRRASGESAGE
jgi:hypothetical protein